MVLKIVRTVWPVMLTYVAIGAPCGMIMGQTGMDPWMVFALSSTFVTGSGQFMICNLWLAGVPAPSIIASVAAISSRFALYSASIAPHLRGVSKRQTLAVTATLTEEAYGISLAKLVEGEDWGPRESFVLNVILIATWGVSCTTGAIVGAVVDVPTAIAAFVCTSLFICLLFSQRLSRGNVVAAVSGAVSVAVCKFLGLTNIAVPASVVVGIAIALACRPHLLIADEPTTALDVTIQAQIMELIVRLNEQLNMGVMLITHDLAVVAQTCSRVIVMYLGQIVEEADVLTLFDHPCHPYTEGLMRSIPRMEGDRTKPLYMIPGTVPLLSQIPTGCRFAPRCAYATERCRQETPQLTPVSDKQSVRCFRAAELAQKEANAQ